MSDYSARRIAGLDLVRSVAILAVIAGHYWPFYERFPGASALEFLSVLGVELFFVLSGFLIGGILLRQGAQLHQSGGTFRWRDAPAFWVRRWFRTLPNYVLFFVLFLLFDRPWANGHWRAWLLSVFFLQNLIVDLSAGTFGIAWSLCVEEWLYLVLPLLLAAVSARILSPARAAAIAATTLIVVPTVLRCSTAGLPWDLGVRHVVIYRLDAIAYGVLLAWFALYQPSRYNRFAQRRWALCGLVLLALVWFHYQTLGRHWIAGGEANSGLKWFMMNVLFFPVLSVAIMPIVAWFSRVTTMPLGLRAIVYRTSLYSYSMYLCHTLVFYFVGAWLYSGLRRLCGEFPGMTFVVAAGTLAAVYAISAGVYHAWEGPMTRLRERFSPPRPAQRH